MKDLFLEISPYIFILGILSLSLISFYKESPFFTRSLLLTGLRLIYLIPFFMMLFPTTRKLEQNPQVQRSKIHFFLDESKSMEAWNSMREALTGKLRVLSKDRGLPLQIHRFKGGQKQFLAEELLRLLESLSPEDKLFVFSDFKDRLGNTSFHKSFPSDMRLSYLQVGDEEQDYSLENIQELGYHFEGEKVEAFVHLRRQKSIQRKKTFLVKVSDARGKFLFSKKVEFLPSDTRLKIPLSLGKLAKGRHDFLIELLTPSSDQVKSNDFSYLSIQVRANTVGVLHLLGAPSFDGRFLRNFVTQEPKFDLVSFYILRDIFDSTKYENSELSLIPFPVKTLFKDEIKSFPLLIFQNFQLSKFVKEDLAESILAHIQKGGRLFYIGGDSAFQFDKILWGEMPPFLPSAEIDSYKVAFPFESSETYTLEMNPSLSGSFELSAIFNYFAKHLRGKNFKIRGLNKIDRKFLKQDAQVLLWARSKDKTRYPLLVMSRLGLGKALWLMSDDIYTLAYQSEFRKNLDRFYELVLRFLQNDSEESFDLSSKLHWLIDPDNSKQYLLQKEGLSLGLENMRWCGKNN